MKLAESSKCDLEQNPFHLPGSSFLIAGIRVSRACFVEHLGSLRNQRMKLQHTRIIIKLIAKIEDFVKQQQHSAAWVGYWKTPGLKRHDFTVLNGLSSLAIRKRERQAKFIFDLRL